jgi:radical SAM superfamily enzyme YgiQ (UPF0313 family)
MRILLISPNQEMLPDPVAPLGLASISSALKAKGHTVRLLDLCFSHRPTEALKQGIEAFQPEVLGFSIRNVDNVAFPRTVSYLSFYRELLQKCRTFTSAPLLLGGSGFTLMPREILAELDADGGVAGEGEEVFPKILAQDFSSTPISIEGWVSRGAAGRVHPARVSDLDGLPSPDWEGIDLPTYFHRGGMGSLQTKRGCPLHCIYCTYPIIEGTQVRLRSPERVAEDALALVQKGIENAFIVDNVFNQPPDHALEICRMFQEKRLPLKWSCYAHPGAFSASLARAMKEAGCTGIEFGIDSGAKKVLERLGKDFSPAQIRQATRLAQAAGLEVCLSLSLGGPGETEGTLRETFDLMAELSPTAVIAMIGLRIFPQTRLAQIAAEEGLIAPSHNFLPPVFYLAPEVSRKILEWAEAAASIHRNWIFPGLGINVSEPLQAKLRRIGVRGPLWEHMKLLRGRGAFRRGSHG